MRMKLTIGEVGASIIAVINLLRLQKRRVQ